MNFIQTGFPINYSGTRASVILFILFLFLSTPAFADRIINSVTLDGESSVSVLPGATISVTINVTTDGFGNQRRWRSTSWDINSTPTHGECADHPNHNFSGNYTETFNITAPTAPGTYDITFVAYRNDSCTQSPSSPFTLSNAITVAPAISSPVAEWRLDELEWNGTLNEVTDSSGNNHHGTAIGGTTVIEPGQVCRAGQFDGSNYLEVSNLSSLLGGTASLSFWIRTTQTGDNTNWRAPGVAGVELSGGTNDIFWGWLDASGRIGISTGNDNSSKSSFAINNGDWRHIVLTRNHTNGAFKIYIDGVLDNSGNTGSGIITTPFSSIGKIENTGGADAHLIGDLDEINIFDSILSNAQVTEIYNAQLAGKNLDGTDRDCEVPLTCFSDNFNRASLGTDWTVSNSNGSFGDPRIIGDRLRLTDASGDVATAATLQRLFPGAGNLIVLEFDYLAYNGSGADGIAVTFSDADISPVPGGYGGSLGYAQRCGIDGFAGGWLGIGIDEYGNFSNPDPGECRSGGPGFRVDSIAVRGSGSGTTGYNYLAGTNTLSPGVDQSGSSPGPSHRYRITIDHLSNLSEALFSVERQLTPSDTWDMLAQGDALATPGQAAVPENWLLSFTGSTGGSTNIHEIDNLSVCAAQMNTFTSNINHFRFHHDGEGLTCSPETIRIQACLDSDCTAESTEPVSATLLPTGWAGGDAAIFNSNDELSLHYTTAGSATLGVSSSTPSALHPSRCYVGGVQQANCNITFHDSGFAFDVPDHTADTIETVTVRAVRKDDETEQCVPGFQNETKAVSFWFDYLDPNTGTLSVNIDSTDISDTSPGTSFDLDFDNNGEVQIDVRYPDVGLMRLNARHEGSGDDAGLVMTGVDQFITRPAYFTLDIPGNPATATDASGAVFLSAGTDFPITVSARNTSGDITPNYGRETTPESVLLTSLLVEPSGGNNPDMDGAFGTFGEDCDGNPAAAGTACGLFNWPEVGIIQLRPSVLDGNYLGAGDVIGTTSVNVGRFIPDHFSVSATNGALDDFCAGFVYTGQGFGYADTPNYLLTARAADGATTLNYTGAFMKLTTGGLTIDAINSDASQLGSDGLTFTDLVRAAGAPGLTDNGDGTVTYVFGNDSFTYIKNANAKIGPYDSDIQLTLSAATDGDGVTAMGPSVTATPDSVEIRFGRLALNNTHGSELIELTSPMFTEYFHTNGYYEANSLDSCTATDLASHYSFTPSGVSSTSGPASPVFVSGESALTFTAPGAGNTGYIDVTTSIATDLPWLLDDRDDDGDYDDEAEARVTFGIYEGSPRHIYIRERY